ncbi:spermidine synthase [Candidatus Altiarchaeota archaeon]
MKASKPFIPDELSGKRLFILLVFVTGAAVMIIEIVGARLMAPYYGSSFFVWTSVIGVILAALSIGYYRGGIEADEELKLTRLSLMLSQAAIYTAFAPFGIQFAGFLSLVSIRFGPLFASLLGLSLPCYQLAKTLSYCIRYCVTEVRSFGRVAGFLYGVSTVGSIFGTFAAGFVLIPLMSVRAILYMMAFILFACSLLVYRRRLAILDLFVIISLGYLQLYSYSILYFDGTESTLVYEKDSVYNTIMIFDRNSSGRMVRSFNLGIQSQGRIDLATNTPVSPYFRYLHLAWSLNPGIRRVLVLGNGGGIGIGELMDAHPGIHVDVVDIDPEVFSAAVEHFGQKKGPNVRFHVGDARAFLSSSHEEYDLILLDVYEARQDIPFHLTTYEMMLEVRDHLSAGGVLAANVISACRGYDSLMFNSYLKTVDRVFADNYFACTLDDVDEAGNIMILSTNSGARLSPDHFLSNPSLADDPVIWGAYSKLEASVGYDGFGGGVFLTDDHAPTESIIARQYLLG